MNAQTFHKLEDMSRSVALWTSLLATGVFGYVFFATNSNFGYHLDRFVSGKEANIDLPVYFGLILAAFLGYLLAGKKQLAEVGGTLAVVAVAGIYGWCGVRLDHSLGLLLMPLAGPALFHLASVEFRRAAERRRAVKPVIIEQPAESFDTSVKVTHEERELVAGVA